MCAGHALDRSMPSDLCPLIFLTALAAIALAAIKLDIRVNEQRILMN